MFKKVKKVRCPLKKRTVSYSKFSLVSYSAIVYYSLTLKRHICNCVYSHVVLNIVVVRVAVLGVEQFGGAVLVGVGFR